MQGTFIVIEGGDGAGKDTQIELLKKDFPQFVYTREPGGTPLGKELHEIVLNEKYGSLPLLTEAFLFLADRAQHAAEVIEPAIAAGKTVVSNRSHISMIAYQLYGRGQFELQPAIESAIAMIYRKAPIDLAIILDVPPEVGVARQQAAGKAFDTMENMNLETRAKVREGFIAVANTMPQAKILDASRSVEEVYKDVKAAVEATLQQ